MSAVAAEPAVPAAMVVARRRKRPPITLIVGAAIMLVLIILSFAIGLISPYSATDLGPIRNGGISASHWLGTDYLGRDLFTRVFVGGQHSLRVSILASVLAAVVGVPLGVISGYYGGATDSVIMRITDTLMALPPILVAIALIVIMGHSEIPLTVGIGIVFIPYFSRVVRAHALTLRGRDFVAAARVACVPDVVIMGRHILPNVMSTVLVQFANTASIVIIVEASLSFLGLGPQAPFPSWGSMIQEAPQHQMGQHPMLLLAPAIVISLATVGWNLLADGLQVALNPKP